MDKELNPKEIKYGLIAIDPTEKGGSKTILHFCGYWDKPDKQDVTSLREELMTDKEFGLTKIAHRLDILPAPDYIVKKYIKDIETYE